MKYFYPLLLLLSCLPAGAQSLYEKYERFLTTPRTYVCYRADGKLKMDGKLNESSWQKAEATAPFVDISGEGFPAPKYETTAKMLWDDDYLYIGAVLEEEDIKARLTRRDTIIYYDNDFEVFIDPDSDGHNYFEIETNARGVIFDLMLDKPYRSGGNFMVQWDCPGVQMAVHCEGTLNKPKDKDKYWSVEMAIPHQALTMNFNNPLKAGNTWRINFSRVQWLKPNGPEENWVWSATGGGIFTFPILGWERTRRSLSILTTHPRISCCGPCSMPNRNITERSITICAPKTVSFLRKRS